MDLGGMAIAAALGRAGVAPDRVDQVLMGGLILAGQGQMPARQAAVKAGIPMTVQAATVNKACLSGLYTIILADLLISSGFAEIVVAGGMESMTQSPYLLPGARSGFRLGDVMAVDALMHDGLTCAFDHTVMGLSAENSNRAVGISRARQDELAALSQQRTASAIKEGRMAEETIPVSVPQRRGSPFVVDTDEGVRPDTTAESLAELKPAFAPDGAITVGNASQISDGAAAVVVASRAVAEELGVTPLGEVLSFGQVAGPDTSLLYQPSGAIGQALGRLGLTTDDVDLFEINEAFAVVLAASMDALGITEERVNLNGGAIALGHPVGMSGTRIALTGLLELRRRGGGTAAIGLCGAGGQGDAVIFRSPV
jgi:acetyl-CoA C-acetyltransferase